MHVPRIGTQLGADLSMFSMFKLLGPIGSGLWSDVRADRSYPRRRLLRWHQMQGTEAMEVLKSIVVTPVMLAIAGKVVAEVVERLNCGEIPGVARAYSRTTRSEPLWLSWRSRSGQPSSRRPVSLGPATTLWGPRRAMRLDCSSTAFRVH